MWGYVPEILKYCCHDSTIISFHRSAAFPHTFVSGLDSDILTAQISPMCLLVG